MKFKHFFIPHTDTHRPAYLISKTALLLYIFLFLTFNLSISVISKINPNILGLSANLNQNDLIKLTNIERERTGLPALTENANLNVAAYKKGQNMFEEQYWAHFAPSGKSPWDFIIGSGYKFSYAGENLARNFYSDVDVVNAWMASSTHKENILSPHYHDIGISIIEGSLNGQPTILVVQEFGTPAEFVTENILPKPDKNSQELAAQTGSSKANLPSPTPLLIAEITPKPTKTTLLANADNQVNEPIIPIAIAGQKNFIFDPYIFLKNIGISLLALLLVLLLFDLYIIRRRAVVRLTAHHFPRIAMVAFAISILINLGRGTIL